MPDVVDNTEDHRFELREQGELAFADYRRHGDRLVIPHVEAALPLRGTGAADRLMRGMVGLAREQGLKIEPVCPYAAVWMRRHPDCADVRA